MKHLKKIFLLASLACSVVAMAQNNVKYPYDKQTCPYYDPDNNKPDFTIVRTSKDDEVKFEGCTYNIPYSSYLKGDNTKLSTGKDFVNGNYNNVVWYAKTDATAPNQVFYVPGIVNKADGVDDSDTEYDNVVRFFGASSLNKSSSNFTKLILPRQTERFLCLDYIECPFIKDLIINSRNLQIKSDTHGFLMAYIQPSDILVNLSSITFTPSVEYIDSNFLFGCKQLNTIVYNAPNAKGGYLVQDEGVERKVFIGPVVETIPKFIFKYMKGLNTVQWDAENFKGMKDDEINTLFFSKFDLIMGSQVESVGANTFYGCNIKSVNAKDLSSWMKIKFANKYSNPLMMGGTLKFLKQGGNIANLGDYSDQIGNTLDLSDYTGAIGNYQFCGCKNIEKIIIPKTITAFGDEFLSGCSNLKEIYIKGDDIKILNNPKALSGLVRENITIVFEDWDTWSIYYNNTNLKGFKIIYDGMPEDEKAKEVTIPFNGIRFASFERKVAIPKGITAYYTIGDVSTFSSDNNKYGKINLIKFNAENEAIPANTVVVLTGKPGDYFFNSTDQYAQNLSTSALKFGGNGGTGVYKYDADSPLPKFVKTTDDVTYADDCVIITPTSYIDSDSNPYEYIYFVNLPHTHTFDANGFCTHSNEYSVRCQAVAEPAMGEDGYYQLTLPAHQQWLANQCLAGESKNARLMNDLDFTNLGQTIVGEENSPYCGNFDGNGHTITLNLTGDDAEIAGVFGHVGNGGNIHHLNVSGLIDRPYSCLAGSVVGFLGGGTVSCCSSNVELRALEHAGGIVGSAVGGTIENCAFTGKFTLGPSPYGIIKMSSGTTVKSCYIDSEGIDVMCGIDTEFQNCYVKSEDNAKVFANGEMCWKLNGESSTGPWKQNLSNNYDPNSSSSPDTTPVLDQTHATVYTCTHCSGKQGYANTDNLGTISHDFSGEENGGEVACANECGALLISTFYAKPNVLCREHSGKLKPAKQGQDLLFYEYKGVLNDKVYMTKRDEAMGNNVIAGMPVVINTNYSKVVFEPSEENYDYKNSQYEDYYYTPDYEALGSEAGLQGVLKEEGAKLTGFKHIVFTPNGLTYAPSVGDITVAKGSGFIFYDYALPTSEILFGDHVYPIEGTIKLATADQLYDFAEMVNAGHYNLNAELATDITVNTKVTFSDGSLYGDKDTLKSWTPIGTDEDGKRYQGTFDGKGYSISGLFAQDMSKNSIALFGSTGSSSVVKNLGLVDSYLFYVSNVGGISANNLGTITDCFSKATTWGYVYGGKAIGGIAATNSGSIRNCYVVANIDGYSDVGCICGINNGTIANCYFYNLYNKKNIGIGTGSGEAAYKTAIEFKYGEVAWLLNGSQAGKDPIWRQNLGQDSYPVLCADHNIVIKATTSSLNSIVRPTAGKLDGAKIYNFAGIKGKDIYGTEYTEPQLAANHPYVFTSVYEHINFIPSNDEVTDNTETFGLKGVYDEAGKKVYGIGNTAGEPVSLVFTTSAIKYANPNGNLVKYGKCYIDAQEGILTTTLSAKARKIAIFEDGNATSIDNISTTDDGGIKAYSPQGVEVGKNYKGIVIYNGKKIMRK